MRGRFSHHASDGYDVTVEYHPVDGFTIFTMNESGWMYKKRYIGWSVKDAIQEFIKDLKEQN